MQNWTVSDINHSIRTYFTAGSDYVKGSGGDRDYLRCIKVYPYVVLFEVMRNQEITEEKKGKRIVTGHCLKPTGFKQAVTYSAAYIMHEYRN